MCYNHLCSHAPVAQLDRASDSDSEGHRFDSCRAYIEKRLKNRLFLRYPGMDVTLFHMYKIREGDQYA